MIAYIAAALMAGIAAGYLNGSGAVRAAVTDYAFNAALLILVFVMGFAFGADRDAAAKVRKAGMKVLLVPLAVACGSVLAGAVGGLALGIDPIASAAASAGFGWYTLTGPLMAQAFGAGWGVFGFAVNFFREMITIIGVSALLRIDRYAPVAAGGATCMDTTLPVTVRYCGPEMLVVAFTSGFVLSLLAPLSIAALISLA